MDEERKRELISKRELAKKLRKAEAEARRKAIKERKPFKGLQIRPTSSLFDDEGRKEPGEDNWSGFGFDNHPHVTFISAFLLIAFITLTLCTPVLKKSTKWKKLYSKN